MKRIQLFEASATKLALFFSALLSVSLVLLSIEIYAITHGETINPLYSYLTLFLVVVICIGLFIISFYVTKRINTIAETADRIITTRDLTQRIPIDSRWDDLSKLSSVLNLMLEDIEQLVDGVRQVSDNIAHDLRTPLTRLRNHIETMRTDRAASSQSEEFSQLIVECDALLTTFNALLRIANIEAGKRHTAFGVLNLACVVHDLIELYEPVAAEHDIQLQFVSEPTSMVGDKDLLFQAAANLLDNAIKYTPPGGLITIAVKRTDTGATLSVTDTGHGIRDEHKQQVFRRFYRVEGCRSRPGSGLGLSLVAAVVKLHQGTITLTDNQPNGLVVTVTL
ncbi:MAG: HAMP domain-containing sensor histidine kinase [Pseudomonadota bacterium]